MKTILSILLLATVTFGQAPAAKAPPEVRMIDNKVSILAEGIQLSRLIRLLDQATGMSSTVSSDTANRTLSVRFTNLDFDSAVRKIFEGQPLDYVVIKGKGLQVKGISAATPDSPSSSASGASPVSTFSQPNPINQPNPQSPLPEPIPINPQVNANALPPAGATNVQTAPGATAVGTANPQRGGAAPAATTPAPAASPGAVPIFGGAGGNSPLGSGTVPIFK